jgi:AraC family ethanolamine operon transcriptional activator
VFDCTLRSPVRRYAVPKDVSQNSCPAPEAIAGLIETRDVEEHAAAVQPWEIRFNQISAGRFHSTLQFVKTPGMMLYEEHGLRRAMARGAVPEGLIMVGTNVDWQQSRMDWCGETVDHRRLACSAPGSEIDFTFPDRNHNVVLLVEPELLTRALGPGAVDGLSSRKHLEVAAKHGQRLIATILTIVRKYAVHPELLDDPREVAAVETRSLDTLGMCINGRDANGGPGSISSRQAAVRRAVEHVHRSTGLVSTLELTSAAGVSRRTLEYGFREMLGVTPAQYLHLHRLNGARRDLSAADPRSSTVVRIARSWGFGHPGRFAAQYRRLFDEMPSKTLRTNRSSPKPRLLDPIPG